jgi:N-glycosylase/DNA lyase
MVRDLKMAYFDLFNIQQLDYILDLPIPVDTRQRSFSKPVDHNGSALLTRA